MIMKELTIQEKASRYDEAIERAKKHYEECKMRGNDWFVEDMEDMFPELKENEDEKTREEITEFFKNYSEHGTWKAISDVTRWIAWLEKQVEQKTTKKIVPKFHEDDWVVSPNGVYWHIDAIRNSRYQVSSNSGYCGNWSLDTNIYHRFTIKDAKPGDVLYDGSNACIFRKKMEDDDAIWVDAYCGINSDGMFNVNDENECWCLACNCVPATKEQRDSLMKAMADAGWEFDVEKKELRKIEQKSLDNVEPKFHEGEWIITDKKHIWYVDETPETTSYLYRLINQHGNVEVAEFEVVDNVARLWTIQDAKPGDMLCCKSGWTCIFKDLDNQTNTFSSYCFMDSDKWFCDTGSEVHTLNERFLKAYNWELYPATKEQCDLLFQKMRESGYEWDAEKKELKKIKYTRELDNSYACVKFPFEAKVKSTGAIVKIHGGQLSQDGKEWIKYQSDAKDKYKVYEPNDLELVYEIEQKQVIDYPDNFPKDNWELIHEFVNKFGRIPKDEDELNVLMEYVLKRQRPVWSKENSPYYDDICEILINLINGNDECINKDVVQKDLDWFTSLIEKNIWKPTEEQMEILQYLCETSSHPNEKVIPILESLLSDLKKLRKE